jgi:hypothetical protein
MFIPPNPNNYSEESALDRQIMWEDYEDHLDRFREAPTEKKEDTDEDIAQGK